MPFGTAFASKFLGNASPRTQSPAVQRKHGTAAAVPGAPRGSQRPAEDDPPWSLSCRALTRQQEPFAASDDVNAALIGALAMAIGDRCCENDDAFAAVWGVRSVEDSKSTRSIIGEDERTRVTPCTSQPYRWITSLLMRFPNNQVYKGSGSIVRIGGPTGRTAVLTCAHNLYSIRNGGYAVEVEVTPAKDGDSAPHGSYTVKQDDFKVAPEYLASEDKRFDYAAIFVSADSPNKIGFGYAALGDDELKGRIVETAGYPADKPDGTMWLSGGLVTAVDAVRLYYTNDTMGGASGSPVWTWATYNFVVVGIHGLGHGTANSCRRLDKALIDRVTAWSKEYE